jgi:GATA-binding protein
VAGLYYKLHGVHRPVAMKKSVIKRRKRVVPAPQGTQASGLGANTSIGSPESDDGNSGNVTLDLRGTVNPDGSVNLGFRSTQEQRPLHGSVAAPHHEDQQFASSINQIVPTSNHSQYHGERTTLSNDKRLPPMTSYPSPIPSLSPNSFLSPNRKRSFNPAETESNTPSTSESNSKRLSSIKSILNPSQQSVENNDSIDPSLRSTATAPSPSSFANSPASTWESGAGQSDVRDVESEMHRAKMERKAELQREAERMREALRAKERELEEFNE